MGQTALHYAVKQGLTATVKLLVNKYRVNTQVMNKMGNTPLHVATINKRINIVKILIAARAQVLAVNKEGYNCLEHA